MDASRFDELARAATGSDKIQSLGGGRYMSAETQGISARGLKSLRLLTPANLSGQVVMVVGRGDSLSVEIKKVLRVDSEEMAVEAALTGDPELVFHSAAYDPLTAAVLSLAEIKEIINEMLEQNRDFLPQFKHFEV